MNIDIFNQDTIERLLHPTPSCRFIVMSKDDSRETIRKFLEKGVDFYMYRPVDIAEMLGAIKSTVHTVEASKGK